jgi:hypothetical protein
MAKKKSGGIRKAIKAAGPNISRSEMKSITKAAGGNVRKAINQISKAGANLASGAANMLIKQQQEAPAMRYDTKGSFGTSKIGQALQQMAGSPSSQRYVKDQVVGQPATPSQMMIGGTVIRPGGKVAVKKQPMGAAPAAPAPAAPAAETTAEPTATGDEFDYASMFGDMMGMMPDYGAMFGDLQSQMAGMFEDLSSQFDVNDPIQLAALGQAYGGDLIRARQRQRKTRADYLRNQMNNMALGGGSAIAPLMIGGGLTL